MKLQKKENYLSLGCLVGENLEFLLFNVNERKF